MTNYELNLKNNKALTCMLGDHHGSFILRKNAIKFPWYTPIAKNDNHKTVYAFACKKHFGSLLPLKIYQFNNNETPIICL